MCLLINSERNNMSFQNSKNYSKDYSKNNNILSILNNKIINNINSNVNKMKYDFNKYFMNNQKIVKDNRYSEEDINIYKIILLLQI